MVLDYYKTKKKSRNTIKSSAPSWTSDKNKSLAAWIYVEEMKLNISEYNKKNFIHMDEMVDDSEPEGEGAPVEPTGPDEPLPEEEELRAWARGEREVRSWRDSVPDDDVIDLD